MRYPKYDGDLGRPNVFVPLKRRNCHTNKVDYLFQAFDSQHASVVSTGRHFSALMRLRGMESKSPSGYAEAFHCRKLLL